MKPRLYPVMLATLLVLFSLYAIDAQQLTSTKIGKLTTRNNVELSVLVNPVGAVVLSSPSHSIFLDRHLARTLEENLTAISVGMKDLESKDTAVVDFRTIGKLNYGVSNGPNTAGMVFRVDLNSTANDKVLLLMYSTVEREDLLFSTTGVVQLGDLVDKALKYIDDIGDQSGYVQSIIEKMRTTVVMNNK